jgi:hypothetical protein
VTFRLNEPRLAPDDIWNEPVMVPPEIAQVGDATPLPVIVQFVSSKLKPVPVTFTKEFLGP